MDNIYYNYLKKNNWELNKDNTKAFKVYGFKGFGEAFSWMTEIALYSEACDHHPEWKNVYNKLEVILTTHDKGKITKKDYELAKKMDMAFEKYKA